MAHCIYLEDSEFDLFKKKEVGVSHCPNSNFWYVSSHPQALHGLHEVYSFLGARLCGHSACLICNVSQYTMVHTVIWRPSYSFMFVL